MYSRSTLFDAERSSLADSLRDTAVSLRAYGQSYKHWAIAYSGGKDSAAVLTVTLHLIAIGEVPKPETLTVLYADTRMELPPLQAAAMQCLDVVRSKGWCAEVVLPAMDDRFYVYMFGRGVAPPSNTFRWCTGRLKIEPMLAALREMRGSLPCNPADYFCAECGAGALSLDPCQFCGSVKTATTKAAEQAGGPDWWRESPGRQPLLPREKLLMLTGVRLGESVARDRRISLSCSRDGGECGQGWFETSTPESVADTLAPLLSWRICHVWDWLAIHAPRDGFATDVIAKVYDADQEGSANELSARTGCVGCNLASQDFAIQRVLRRPEWAYLSPLLRLKPLYAELKKPERRLRKPGGETRTDGSLCKKQGRLGPLTIEARLWGLDQVLEIQRDINDGARAVHQPGYSLIDREEEARIRELIAARTWPRRWSGDEPRGDSLDHDVLKDGSIQHWLFSEGEM